LDVQSILRVLPNRDVVALDPLPPGDVLFLEYFSTRTSDAVWQIQLTKLIETMEQGYSAGEIQEFLQARSGQPLPDTVALLLQETAEQLSCLQNRGAARLVEAQDAALAQLIANDRRLSKLCLLAGERHIIIPEASEPAFRRALHELGYGVSADGGAKQRKKR
jgi:hypothetical protein